jgi:hypothetical protein
MLTISYSDLAITIIIGVIVEIILLAFTSIMTTWINKKTVKKWLKYDAQDIFNQYRKDITNKQILFIYQKEDERLISTKNFFAENGFTKLKIFAATELPHGRQAIEKKLIGRKDEQPYTIVYQTASKDDEHVLYIASAAKENKQYCVFLCQEFLNDKINRELRQNDYATTVNGLSKLRETLYMLMFFAPNS